MNTTMTIKLPKKLHMDAKKTAGQLGIPLTTVTTALLRQFVFDKEITLSVKKPRPAVLSSIQELHEGRGKKYNGSTADFFKMLDDK